MLHNILYEKLFLEYLFLSCLNDIVLVLYYIYELRTKRVYKDILIKYGLHSQKGFQLTAICVFGCLQFSQKDIIDFSYK